jgi:UDP-glucose 4-epimerase
MTARRMKLLVTGGAGYIGSVVARQLLRAGHEVAVLDSLARGHRAAVPGEAELLEVDLLDAAATGRALSGGYDGVLHFAALALVAESVEFPERYWHNNVVGTRNLLDAMRAHGVQRLVFSSTCAVYGEPEKVPMDESTPTAPVNSYGASKLAVDLMIENECRAHDLGATSLRYFNVAGHERRRGRAPPARDARDPAAAPGGGGPARALLDLRHRLPDPDGTAVRDYIHVEDLGEAHLLALEALTAARHEVYNLGNGAGFSVREVVAAAERVVGRSIPRARRPARPATRRSSSRRARRSAASWGGRRRKPELETMIADAWEWARRTRRRYVRPAAG